MKYEQPSAGGAWDHRSGDCSAHGDNVPHARPHRSSESYLCRACLLGLPAAPAPVELAKLAPTSKPPVHARQIFYERTATSPFDGRPLHGAR